MAKVLANGKKNRDSLVVSSVLSQWIYGSAEVNKNNKYARPERRGLPVHLRCPEDCLRCAAATDGGKGRPQYAIVLDDSTEADLTAYLVFRGTLDPFDWTINLDCSCVPMAAGGLAVHNGVLGGLNDVTGSCLAFVTKKLREIGVARIVVCGHSLGGGYAVIAAAHLLHHQLPISQVFTFGSPMVIGRGQEDTEMWKRLNQRTTYVVYNRDIVPRTSSPTAGKWLFEFVPNFLMRRWDVWFAGGVQVFKKLENNRATFEYFSPCGTTFLFAGNFAMQRKAMKRCADIKLQAGRGIQVSSPKVVLSRYKY
jgi:hypothetical protein